MVISAAIYVPFVILAFFTSKSPSPPTQFYLIEYFAFIIVTIYYLFESMRVMTASPIYQSITFWIIVGYFLYFSGNFFFLLLLSNIDKTNMKLIFETRILYLTVTLLKDIVFALAFLIKDKANDQYNESFYIPEELHLDSFNPKSTLN